MLNHFKQTPELHLDALITGHMQVKRAVQQQTAALGIIVQFFEERW